MDDELPGDEGSMKWCPCWYQLSIISRWRARKQKFCKMRVVSTDARSNQRRGGQGKYPKNHDRAKLRAVSIPQARWYGFRRGGVARGSWDPVFKEAHGVGGARAARPRWTAPSRGRRGTDGKFIKTRTHLQKADVFLYERRACGERCQSSAVQGKGDTAVPDGLWEAR